MTLSVTIYFPAHCGHTGSPDSINQSINQSERIKVTKVTNVTARPLQEAIGGDVPQGRLWEESLPRRLRPCAVLWPCTCCSDRYSYHTVKAITNEEDDVLSSN